MSVALRSSLASKTASLDERLRSLGSVAVAFSGGVDSTALLHACARVLGAGKVLAVTADSESLPRHERDETVALASRIGTEHLLVRSSEMDNPEYRRNDGERCYFCKKELFGLMERVARERNIPVLVYGAIAEDLLDHRPGARAAREFRVEAPLQDAGWSKDEIREYSRHYGLPTASKSSFACLSSRIPRGTEVNAQILARVEEAEAFLRAQGYRQYRVRHHGDLAKVEVSPEETARLLAEDAAALFRAMNAVGYQRVAIDLRGYRSPASAGLVSLESPFWASLPCSESEAGIFVSPGLSREALVARLRKGDSPSKSLLWEVPISVCDEGGC